MDRGINLEMLSYGFIFQRHGNAYFGACLWFTPEVKSSSHHAGPLFHGGQSQSPFPAPAGQDFVHLKALPVIFYGEPELMVFSFDGDGYLGCLRVFADIGQRFLYDPVDI